MIKIKFFFLFLFILFFNVSISFSSNSAYNNNTLKARELIFDFKFTQAEKLLEKDKTPISFYLKTYSIFLQNLLISGEENQELFNNSFDKTEDIIDDLDDDDKNKKLLLSEIFLQSAIIKLMNKDFVSGSIHFVKSYGFLEDQIIKYPNYKENKKLSGLYKIIAGITPDKGKKFLKMIGLEGDIISGYKELNQYLIYTQQKQNIYIEAYSLNLLIHTFLKENLDNENFKFHLVNKEKNSVNSTVLFSNILKNYKFGESKDLQKNIILIKEKTDKEIPILYYFLGVSLTTENKENAKNNLLRFISTNKNENFIKASYWQMARIAVLSNNNEGFEKYRELTKTEGGTFTAADKQALNEAEETLKPNKILLKARLLFDVGKYDLAYNLLKQNPDNYKSNEEKAEYLYRLGRIEYMRENYKNAKIYFARALKNYSNTEKYFIPYSALELAYIYQKEKNIEKQKYYFNKALELNKSEYQNSIKQKANSGLKQLTN